MEDERDVGKASRYFLACQPERNEATLFTRAALQHIAAKWPSLKELSIEVGSEFPSAMPITDNDWRLQAVKPERRQSNASHDTGYESQEEDDYDYVKDASYEQRLDECVV
jgi:hypothetical protein